MVSGEWPARVVAEEVKGKGISGWERAGVFKCLGRNQSDGCV